MKKLFSLGAVILAISLQPPLALAQNNLTESLTITTYYPSPYGVYRNLKLNPTEVTPSGPALSPGVMFYNNTSDTIMYYNNAHKWVNLTEGNVSGGLPLVNSAHTQEECAQANGEILASDVGLKQCRFNGGGCPTGWNPYKDFTTTTAVSGKNEHKGCGSAGDLTCSLDGHSWGNIPHENTQPYSCAVALGNCPCCGRIWTGITQIGCY
jgi:hypothetical protein